MEWEAQVHDERDQLSRSLSLMLVVEGPFAAHKAFASCGCFCWLCFFSRFVPLSRLEAWVPPTWSPGFVGMQRNVSYLAFVSLTECKPWEPREPRPAPVGEQRCCQPTSKPCLSLTPGVMRPVGVIPPSRSTLLPTADPHC